MFQRSLAALISMILLVPTLGRAETVLVAAAANFAGAAEAVAAAFQDETGHEAQITTGSTGKLYAQITEGAPFDVLLSADTKTPERLEAEGRAVPQSRFTYAIGGLTLWSLDAAILGADPKAALLAETVRFVGLANPDLAPYGVAARETLISLGLWDAIQPKVVLGQNIGQVFALASAGAADVAFVARSALDAPGTEAAGSRWDVPQEMFTPLAQDAVLLDQGKDNPAAVAFVDFLKTDEAREIIARFGYDLP